MSMKKINWKNGTQVSPAKVLVNGVSYDVTDAVYEGETPITANNLNEMQDNAEEYVDENMLSLKPIVLFEGESITSVTLSDDANNYERLVIEITPKQHASRLGRKYLSIFPENRSYSESDSWYISDTRAMYCNLFRYTILDNTITINMNQSGVVTNDNAYDGAANVYAITKVLGYKVI